jgi:AmmeMemoRadiSam system protein B
MMLAATFVWLENGNITYSSEQVFSGKVREPAVAGQFYPEDASELAKILKHYLERGAKPLGEKPAAILAPHAGYVYSGQTAADAFRQAAAYDYDLVVILGTNHTTFGFSRISVYPGDYKTPLGIAKTDRETANRLTASGDDFVFDESLHIREHSVEVQIPFVQTLFPKAGIVPLVAGAPDAEMCSRAGKTLARVIKDRNALIVASSDLSHYPAYEDAVRADHNTLNAIVKADLNALQSLLKKQESEGIPGLSTCACGAAPIFTAVAAAKELGADQGRLVSYANSGDAPFGNRSRVVGYGAAAFVKKP